MGCISLKCGKNLHISAFAKAHFHARPFPRPLFNNYIRVLIRSPSEDEGCALLVCLFLRIWSEGR